MWINKLLRGAWDEIIFADLSRNGTYDLWNLAKKGCKKALKDHTVLCGGAGNAWSVSQKELDLEISVSRKHSLLFKMD